MKIINAIWQRKNLGLTSTEFEFENTDTLDVLDIVKNSTTEYDVVSVPLGRIDVISGLEKLGFNFVETYISFKRTLSIVEPNKLLSRLKSRYSLEECTDLDVIYNEVSKGMFGTDRVTLDPFFKDKDTSIRYINRMEEEKYYLKTFLLKNGTDYVGFISVKDCGDNRFLSFLGGAFPKYDGLGVGYLAIYYGLEIAKSLGGKRITTGTSSNNIGSLKIHLDISYSISSMNYLLVKHR